MASVKIRESHALSRDEARRRVGAFEEMIRKYRAKLRWSGDRARVEGVGFGGSVEVSDQAVEVVLKLGLLARAAGVDPDRLQGAIARRLRAALDDGEADP